MVHVVVLIISTNLTEYERQAKAMWRRYMNLKPEIDCIFIENDETMNSSNHYDEENNLLKIKEEESPIPGIYLKTIKSFQWVLQHPKLKTCDYIIRTNLSSFWIFDRLLEKLPRTPPSDYVLAQKVFNQFPSGCGMVMSKTVVENLCTIHHHQDTVNQVPDDVIIGESLRLLGITTYNDGDFHHDFNTLPKKDCYHVRCKLGHTFEGVASEMRLEREIPFMNFLIDTYYNTFYIHPRYFKTQIIVIGDFEKSTEIDKKCNVLYIKEASELENNREFNPSCIIANTDISHFERIASYALLKKSDLHFYIKHTYAMFRFLPLLSNFNVYHQNSRIIDVESYLLRNESCILTLRKP